MSRRVGTRATVATLLLATLPLVSAAGASSAHDDPTTTTTSSDVSVPGTTVTITSVKKTSPDANPFRNARLAAYLKDRSNLVTAAVYDVKSGKTYVYNPGVQEKTASMAKIDILAALLWQHQQSGTAMTARQIKLATSMIEQSNNNSANALFDAIGSFDGISAFNKLLGFSQTTESYDWGQIETTPFDQLKLLKAIVLPNRILTTTSREYEMGLMQDVISSERWGLGWGSPAGALVGQKNGWYPESDTGWQINTTGYVEFHGRTYLATIMNTKNPDENYGISTATQVSTYLWQFLKP